MHVERVRGTGRKRKRERRRERERGRGRRVSMGVLSLFCLLRQFFVFSLLPCVCGGEGGLYGTGSAKHGFILTAVLSSKFLSCQGGFIQRLPSRALIGP
jgi:hypothetical protein